MIKKLLLLSSMVLLIKFALFGQVCVPSPTYTNTSTQAGIYPDSVTNFDTAYVGSLYNQVITIVVPPDTQVFPPPFLPVKWDSTRLDSVQGLPASMSYACVGTSTNTSRCVWIGNSIGCAKISGTPGGGEVGVYMLKFYTGNYVGGMTSPKGYIITYYKMIVMPALNIANEIPNIHTLLQNTPNPFADKSEIQFSAENNGVVQFKVYNMIGTVIQNYDLRVKKGINKLELDAKDFDSGIYFYSMVQGSHILTRKMIVNK